METLLLRSGHVPAARRFRSMRKGHPHLDGPFATEAATSLSSLSLNFAHVYFTIENVFDCE